MSHVLEKPLLGLVCREVLENTPYHVHNVESPERERIEEELENELGVADGLFEVMQIDQVSLDPLDFDDQVTVPLPVYLLPQFMHSVQLFCLLQNAPPLSQQKIEVIELELELSSYFHTQSENSATFLYLNCFQDVTFVISERVGR